jgi:hypothetical protein
LGDWQIGRLKQISRLILIGKKEVKFVTIKNIIGTAESEILEWKSSLSQLNRIIVTRDTANRYLKRLINLNIIERKGRSRFVYYVLREK